MTLSLRRGLKLAAVWLPSLAPARAARDIVKRANAARDARRYQAAAALYGEASRLDPTNSRIYKQCGHMCKEAGDFPAAERHYLEAFELDPADADLQLQLGHFYKVSGRMDEAATAYARALELKSGWKEAADELALISGRTVAEGRPQTSDLDGLGPELLPGCAIAPEHSWRETIQIRRLGVARVRTSSGYRRVLRGIEAIRGFAVSSARLLDVTLLLDGEPIATETLQTTPLDTDYAKYVFNIWHDFGSYAPGECEIEVRLRDEDGRTRGHRAILLIASPVEDAEASLSDTIVTAPPGAGTLEQRINARPSIARSAKRRLLKRHPRTILVQRVDQLGDLVVSVPAIRQLRVYFPDARLIALVTSANAELAATLGLFDDVITADFFDGSTNHRRTMSKAAQQQLQATLATFSFDIAIDLAETGESRPLLLLSGADLLFGFKDRDFPWLTAGFELSWHDPINHLEILPPATKLMAMIDALARMIDTADEPLHLAGNVETLLEACGVDPASPYLVLHDGARLAYSRWPGFQDLVRLLLTETDLPIVFMGSPFTVAELAEHSRVHVIEGMIDFPAFDALLARAAVFVGNDSGPKHLAALRGTPVVSLHMARLNWNEWGQQREGIIISRRVPCAGCGIGSDSDECGKKFACITYIRPDEVAREVVELLRSNTLESS